MCRIVDKLINIANVDTKSYQINEHDNDLLQGSDASIKHPNGIWDHLNDDELDAGLAVSHDFDIVNKTGGFLNDSSANFSFTCPDREHVNISTIHQCFVMADIIRNTGPPNYRQTKIPISAGLNLQAWVYRLRNIQTNFCKST